MVNHTQTIRRQKPTNCLSVFDHFVGLALKRLRILICKTPSNGYFIKYYVKQRILAVFVLPLNLGIELSFNMKSKSNIQQQL